MQNIASQTYICGECRLVKTITEDDPNFPDAAGWELIEDDITIQLGAEPYWLCPKCQAL